MDVFTIADPQEAKGCYGFGVIWQWIKNRTIQKFVSMIKSHWSGITAYFDKRLLMAYWKELIAKYNWPKKS